jgi:N-acetylglutamate synthase-like GNAT family acetyltransferase
MARTDPIEWRPRLAREADVAALEALIPLSVRALQAPYYSQAQMDAAIGPVFGVDRQLVRDGTYFVVERDGRVIGCGGWSRRGAMCGSSQGRSQEEPELDPRVDAARIRAFFVHPAWARRGVGRSIMDACERAISEAGFRDVVIMSTLAGEPLYASFGYAADERSEVEMEGGLRLAVVRMTRTLSGAAKAPHHPEAEGEEK